MKKILVTGGSGFLGRHLIQRLLKEYKSIEVKSISRNENEIRRMLEKCGYDRLTPVIGDIRDLNAIKYAVKGVDTVVHLAAMKHIDFCEKYPYEAITMNIIGTKNILEQFAGDAFVAMSTDKAVQASSCYGATKLLMEKMILDYAKKKEGKRHMIIRSGNIFGSSGSVIERWREQIKQKNEIIVTNPDMTRFFINVESLVDFIIEVLEKGENGNIYIPYQKAIRIGDLAEEFISLYGNKATKIKIIGLREGEKMHELLFTDGEDVVSFLESKWSQDAQRLSREEIRSWLKALEN